MTTAVGPPQGLAGLRNAEDLFQDDLAYEAGVNQSDLSRFEKG
jgi:predicted transcriptional regulator